MEPSTWGSCSTSVATTAAEAAHMLYKLARVVRLDSHGACPDSGRTVPASPYRTACIFRPRYCTSDCTMGTWAPAAPLAMPLILRAPVSGSRAGRPGVLQEHVEQHSGRAERYARHTGK